SLCPMYFAPREAGKERSEKSGVLGCLVALIHAGEVRYLNLNKSAKSGMGVLLYRDLACRNYKF
ncbi:MAG: hypothetical protein Q9180_005366, partial [Flavoplaca navasiana]